MVNAIENSSAASAPKAAPKEPALTANADFETFLKMLTAQLKNQDPLNPMEGTDFAVQLATFSNVEQQTKTNQLLSRLTETSLLDFAGWIGKEARTTAPVHFGHDPLTLEIEPTFGADEAVLEARDALGNLVSRETIEPHTGITGWFGRYADGTRLPEGKYKFSLESRKNGKIIGETDVPVYSRIEATRIGSKGIEIVLENGVSVGEDDIDGLREPG